MIRRSTYCITSGYAAQQYPNLVLYSVFPSVILSEAKDLRGAMRPLAVLQSSALWLSRILIGNTTFDMVA
jgi:hypothetical protein